MSKIEIAMRLLSAEARVPLHHMRSGTLTDDDWTEAGPPDGRDRRGAALHRRLPEHDDDGDPGQGRRLKQRHDLKLDRRRLPAADDVAASGPRAASRRSRTCPEA